MKRLFKGFLLSIVLLFASGLIQETLPFDATLAPYFHYDIQSHSLSIQIDPAKHLLRAEDRLEVQWRGRWTNNLSFLLHPSLRVTRVLEAKTLQPLPWGEVAYSESARRVEIPFPRSSGSFSVAISYEGTLYDPVVKEKALQFVRGDQTSGLIGPEGVYLSHASHWYPDRPQSLASFEVEATIPAPFRVVTQGRLISEEVRGGSVRSKWIYDLPAESLTLVAGPYTVRSRQAGSIKVSTYFLPEDEKFSETFLDGAEEYLKLYSDLLGQYPFTKFDIVQNFFSSGYGFPTFTLLAPETIRQGKEFLRPGALDHEIVHSWWGHSVMNKPGTGNWVEALTAYCANYYYRELKLGEESARKYRQEVMQKYAIQVPPSKDYPLRDFEGKENEVDGQIGYGKGSMVFHMLRRLVGKDLFFATLKAFSRSYGGKQATWKDIQKIFEESSDRKLEDFFSQWLDRTGGPRLKLEGAKTQVTPKGYLVSGEVVQEGETYDLPLTVEVDEGAGKRSLLLEVSKRRTPFSMEGPRSPLSLRVDPDYQIFRRLYPEEVVPCLNALLEDRDKILVVPERGDEESRKIYADLAKMVQMRKSGRIVSEKELTEADVRNASVFFLGESWKNPVASRLLSSHPSPIRLREGSWTVEGESLDEGDESLLMTYPHPMQNGKWVTLYFGISPGALSRAQYIFFYGWDSYLVFKKGRPLKRGTLAPLRSMVSCNFLPFPDTEPTHERRLKEHVTTLASPELGGRHPGTAEYLKAQAYIAKQLEGMGLPPIYQPFSITVRDIDKTALVMKTGGSEQNLKAVPFRFSKEGEWEGPVLSMEMEENERARDIPGKAVLIRCHDGPKNLQIKTLLDKIKSLQSKGAAAAIFLIQEGDLENLAPYITYPSYFTPKLEARFRGREGEGFSFNRAMEASKTVAKAEGPNATVDLPVLLLPYSPQEEERLRWALEQKEVTLHLSVHFKRTRLSDSNIGGVIEGQDPERKGEFLILGAHYDHLGKNETTGAVTRGRTTTLPEWRPFWRLAGPSLREERNSREA